MCGSTGALEDCPRCEYQEAAGSLAAGAVIGGAGCGGVPAGCTIRL